MKRYHVDQTTCWNSQLDKSRILLRWSEYCGQLHSSKALSSKNSECASKRNPQLMPKQNRISIGFKHQVDTKLDLDLHRQLITPDRLNVLRETEGAPQLARCLWKLSSSETWESKSDREIRQRNEHEIASRCQKSGREMARPHGTPDRNPNPWPSRLPQFRSCRIIRTDGKKRPQTNRKHIGESRAST